GLRKDSGIWKATTASGKAALVPVTACIAMTSLSVLHYWSGFREIHGHSVSFWIWKNIVLSILAAFLFAFAGASFARVVNRFRRAA
ncbi:MAG TPA: hypothetical protein VLU73_12430, partial [Methylococcaceae bacterium]|nr:hypothetical protein [Methylococcaceae bacterium]